MEACRLDAQPMETSHFPRILAHGARGNGKAALQGIIKGKVALENVIHSDRLGSYNALVDLGYGKHYRVDHGGNEFVYATNHISGIKNFWGIARVRPAKFRGLSQSTFHLHLKYTEFRFNQRKEDLYKLLLKLLRQNPLKLP